MSRAVGLAEKRDIRGPEIARRVAAYGLSGPASFGEPFDIAESQWKEALGCITGERLIGLAAAAMRDGWLTCPDGLESQLIERHRSAMLWALNLERTLLRLVQALHRSEVEVVVLKGPALAHSIYPSPALRPFGDLDLLVRSRDWRAASATLEGSGLRRRLPEPRAGFDERFGKAVVWIDATGIEVDVHRTLVLGPFGLWVDPDELFERACSFSVGGQTLQRLDDTDLLLHACMHASLGASPPLLLPLRDVAQAASVADVDWDELARRAERRRLGLVVKHAMRASSEILRIEHPPEAADVMHLRHARREQQALKAYTTSRRYRGGMDLSTLRAIRGIRGKLAYVFALVVPDRRFLEARSPSRPSYLRRWAVPLRWLRSGRR